MANITNLKDKSGNIIYPTTRYNAVFDANGATLPDDFSKITTQEISSQYIRITDLSTGVYKLTYAGTKYIYYNGTSGTETHTVTGLSGSVILTVNKYSTTRWHWYYINGTTSYASIYFGYTSTSAGAYSSKALNLIPTTPTVTDLFSGQVSAGNTITLSQSMTNFRYLLLIGCDQTNGGKAVSMIPVNEFRNNHASEWDRVAMSTESGWCGVYYSSTTKIVVQTISSTPNFNWFIVRGVN